MKRGRYTDLIVLIVLCAMGALFGRLQSSARERGRLDFVSQSVATAVNPMARVFGAATDAVGDFVVGVASARSLRARVRTLEMERQSMALYDQRVEELGHEIDELRKLNGIGKRAGTIRIPAEVIGYIPRENRITLGVGSTAGVVPGLAVVSSAGLLGIVVTVSPSNCQVSLLGSLNLTIGAMVARTPPSAGLLQGSGGNSMSIEFNDPKAVVKAGDLVITSGFSEKIPRGIVIGRVLSVDDIPEMGQRRANVFASAALGSAREVLVLR